MSPFDADDTLERHDITRLGDGHSGSYVFRSTSSDMSSAAARPSETPAIPDPQTPVNHEADNGHLIRSNGQANGSAPDSSSPPEVPVPPSTASPENQPPSPTVPQPETSTDEVYVTPESASETGFLPVLRNLNFLALWCGQVFSQVADKIYLVLMIAIIASRFQLEGQSISGWVAALMIVFTIPAVLFGFAAGVFVDRWPKRIVLVTTNVIRGVVVFALPGLLWISSDWQPVYSIPVGFFLLLGVTFLVSTLTQFFAPAEQAAIPLLVEKKHLLSANSLYTTTMMASVIVGFALGEPCLELADDLMRSLNAHVAVNLGSGREVFVGLCYGIAGLILLLIRPTRSDQSSEGESPNSHIWDDMREGLQFLRDHHQVRSALIQLVILFSVFAALAVLAVRLAELIPVIDSDQFGFLLAAGGVGLTLGAALVGQFGQQFRRSLMSLVGSIGMACCLGLLSFFTQQLWPALITIGLLGGFAAIVGIPMQTTIQAETPETMRGKVFGLQNNAVNIALSLPLALAGVAETVFGLPAVLWALSAIVIAGGLLTWYSSRMGSKRTHTQSS